MGFLSTIGLDSKYIDSDKYKLSKIFVKDCISEYTPAVGTAGILVNILKNEDKEQVKSTEKEDFYNIKVEDPEPLAVPNDKYYTTHKKLTKMKSKSQNDFIIFPYASIKYSADFCLRKVKRLIEVHKSEIFVADEPFMLHKTVNNTTMENLDAVEFDCIMSDVYKYGAVSICISSNNALKSIINTLKNAAIFFKFNCLLKFNTDVEGMSTKYGPASTIISVIQPGQFLPIFGKEDGCIIHISLVNKKGIVFDIVGLAANEEEPIFSVDGALLYTKQYKNSFISTTIPHIKKYAKHILVALNYENKAKAAKI